MRFLLAGLMMVGCAAFVFEGARADDKDKEAKEVTLKGKITCGKCDLAVDKGCATVIVVKEEKKDIVYYFDSKGHKANHGKICQESKPGSVTGVVSEDGKKKIITVKSVKFD